MTREELKVHCEKQIKQCEMWAKYKGEEPSGKIYEEHRLILELLEQKPKIGHWIDIDSESFEFHRVYKCSECGNTEIEYPERICRHFRYCPNCGAKMESEG